MPKGMGNLTSLQTLHAFLVDGEDGCRIVELKNMNYLSGAFCISRLENVLNSEEAKEAALSDKQYIDKLELRWSDLRNEEAVKEEEVLEFLQPHSGPKELEILFYRGSKLPSWISNPSFAMLANITFYKCTNCRYLPLIGELPALKRFSIFEMNTVKRINHQFLRKDTTQGHHAFPRLERLAIDVMLNLEQWIGVENGDFPCLHKFTLEYCPKLVALPSFSSIKSLKHLEINYCPKLLSLPEEGLPSSVDFLVIRGCPALMERCRKGEGEDWGKIAHVPSIRIDNQEISSS
ncbi:hypothetical protein L1049_008193 [Liquidambar formosana]|uniref:R13L1/DRL21-like LRR repeat region domain-containing protein n=1 Tax=Liquidambar formosana TaxID=63359 RepID=A0AAP0S9A6_LIQFO